MARAIERRQFVQAAAGSAVALGPMLRVSGQAPALERVRLGVIGCGGRGRELITVLQQFADVEIPVVSDVIEPRMEQAAKLLTARNRKVERVVEHERILERKDIDAVVIATTQHWHGRPFIQAAQAGKAIFVEKPLSHTVVEGRAMVEAARKHGVLAMMGIQQRGCDHYQRARDLIRSGRLGKVALVECWNYHNTGARVGRAADGKPPQGTHWDRWLGPAPLVPFNPSRLNNSWWFAYAGGMMTNWAIHHIDTILWAMEATTPTAASCAGGKLVVNDLADTPDTVEASWEFPGFLMHYTYRGFNNFPTVQSRLNHHGICFHGSRGTLVLDRSGYELYEEPNPVKVVDSARNPRRWRDGQPGNEVDGPWQRLFVDRVKDRRRPPLDFEEGHRATVCCHLANIAYLTGRKVRWDGKKETIPGDAEAARLLARPRRKGYELPRL